MLDRRIMDASPPVTTDEPASTLDTLQLQDVEAQIKLQCNKRVYFFAYMLLYAFHGCLLSLPGAIYLELQTNLQTSTSLISWIYSTLAISAAISAFAAGSVVRRFKSTQRLLSATVCLEVIALTLIPFTRSIAFMFVLFVFIGIGYSSVDVMGPVFIFRTFPIDGQHVFFLSQTMLSITSMTFPLFIQLSIQQTNDYLYPFLVLATTGLVFVVLSCFLSTPQHDELRTVKRRIAKKLQQQHQDITVDTGSGQLERSPPVQSIEMTTATTTTSSESTQKQTNEQAASIDEIQEKLALEASGKLASMSTYRQQQYGIVTLLVLLMLMHTMMEFGGASFITTYVSEYLQADESYGRYLISVYWASNLFGRICHILFTKMTKLRISPIWSISTGFVVRLLVIGVLWGLFVDENVSNSLNLTLLFVAFGMNGFFANTTFPGLLQWAEKVMSIDGMVSCMFLVGNQAGCAIIAPLLGFFMQFYSAKVLPFVLLFPALLGTLLVVVNVTIYRRCYKQLLIRSIANIHI